MKESKPFLRNLSGVTFDFTLCYFTLGINGCNHVRTLDVSILDGGIPFRNCDVAECRVNRDRNTHNGCMNKYEYQKA